jgi:hypothetical protein
VAKPRSPKPPAQKTSLLTADPVEVGKRVSAVLALLAQAEEALGPLVELSEDARLHANGRFRDGESAALENLLDTADAFSSLFVAIADRDQGADADAFESKPTRDNLARRDHLARLAGALDPLTRGVGDTVLALGASVREVTTPAYAIARIGASLHPKMRAKLAATSKYYGAPAVKAPQTKKKSRPKG